MPARLLVRLKMQALQKVKVMVSTNCY
jgi:hypothetical protein